MADLTENEIFDCLKSNLRLAIEHCALLATTPYRGPVYDKFRNELRLIEGSCRQAGYWRNGDSRWLKVGMMIAEAHKRAGNWLRSTRSSDGVSGVKQTQTHPLFLKLAENLRGILVAAERLETAKTNRFGPVLPEMPVGPLRNRAVQVRTPGGIILPDGYVH